MIFEPKKRLIRHDEKRRICTENVNEKISFYKNCSDIPDYPLNKKNINFNLINFWDFKISEECFKNPAYESLLNYYLTSVDDKRVLHVVNHNTFELNEWYEFINIINDIDIKGQVHMEIHYYNYNLKKLLELTSFFNMIEKIESKKFEIIDLHLNFSNSKAYYVNLKCHEDILSSPITHDSDFMIYNPNATRVKSIDVHHKHFKN